MRAKQRIKGLETELARLKGGLNELEHKHRSLNDRAERLMKHYEYRVQQDGDVWKAYLVSYDYSHGLSYERPGRAFFGATKVSAVKKMKVELLAGTSPGFIERTGPHTGR